MKKMTSNISELARDPSDFFKSPFDVLRKKELSKDEKISILLQWAYDERELAVAEEENMQRPGNEKSNRLSDVLNALLELDVNVDKKL